MCWIFALSHSGHTDISLIRSLFEGFLILSGLRLLLGGMFGFGIAIHTAAHIMVFDFCGRYFHRFRAHLIAVFVHVINCLVLGLGFLADPLGH